jgi:transmembrane sensor
VKDYRKFSVNDFAMDDYFQAWVLHPDENSEAFWRHWRTKHPEKVAEINEAREILNNFNLRRYALPAENVSNVWSRIQKINNADRKGLHGVMTFRWLSGAACALLLGSSAAFLWWPDAMSREYRTGYGETKAIRLPDSSTVILNANSRVSFKNNWESQPAREVEVDGEAFFSVVHKADDQPFRVTTDDGVAVEVLGTTFNIYHRSIDTKVVLNTGQISLSIPAAKKEKKILMKPGELVECRKNEFKKSVVDPRIYAAWTENKIILNQTSLREMIRIGKDNYGIDIGVASEKMLDQTVSGSMPTGDADAFVKQVSRAFQLKMTRENNSYVLKDELTDK